MSKNKKSKNTCCSCENNNEEKHGFWYRLFHWRKRKNISDSCDCECEYDNSEFVFDTKSYDDEFKSNLNSDNYKNNSTTNSFFKQTSTSEPIFNEQKILNQEPIEEKKQSLIPENQKHTIVTFAQFKDYNLEQRRKDWHKYAGHNERQLVCSLCKDDDNWETIKLENGKHICYFCWIKKPTEESIKIFSTPTVKPKANEIPEDQKHTIVSLEEFSDYNYEQRRKDWHKKAGYNSKRMLCSICKSKDNWATIQLENGKHICYFCWIKKPVQKKKKSNAKKKVATKK